MNLMSNARLFEDDGKKNDLMFDMLPQVKFNMMGQIQIQQELTKKSSRYSCPSPPSSQTPSPNASGSARMDKTKLKSSSDSITFESSSGRLSDRTPLSSPPTDRDSPLDFSKKKIEENEPDSACSRLRKILKMRASPETSSALNLTKEIHQGHQWDQGRRSGSSSPDMDTSPYTSSQRHPIAHPLSFGMSPFAMLNTTIAQPGSVPMPMGSPNGRMFPQGAGSHNFGSLHAPTMGTLSSAGITKSRVTRPFKAYPKDPLTFPTVGLYGLPVVAPAPGVTEALIHQQSNHAYAEFRKQMLNQSGSSRSKRLSQKHSAQLPLSDSTTSSTNSMEFGLGISRSEVMSGSAEECLSNSDDGFNLAVTQTQSESKSRVKSDDQLKDDAYWERRRKNNEAAKRSRDARRAKEDEIAIRAAFLEQENLKLRFEVCALKNETAKLRCLLYKAQ